jgi:hypothetical protein
MNEVLGLNKSAWETWVAYRKKIRKPLKEVSYHAAQTRLASFGDGQMEAVLTSIANGWQGVFPPGKKAQSQVRAEQKKVAQSEAEKREFDALRARAANVGFRGPYEGEDLVGYRTLVSRAESRAYYAQRGIQTDEYGRAI